MDATDSWSSRGCVGRGLTARPWWRAFRDVHFGVSLQLLETAVGDNVSRINSFYRGKIPVRLPDLDVAHQRSPILNDVYERCLAVVLNGGSGNYCHAVERVYQQPSVYE